MRLAITIDTNVINTKNKLQGMNVLERWHREEKIEIIGAERLKDETENYPPAKTKVEALRNVSEPATWGISKWGKGYWSDGDGGPGYLEIAKVLFPGKDPLKLSSNDESDVMHLVGHAHGRGKIFVTMDGNFLKFANELKDKFMLEVMTPDQAVTYLSEKFNWE